MKITFPLDGFTQAVKWVLDVVDAKNINSTIRMDVNKDTGNTVFSAISMNGERTFDLSGDLSDASDVAPYELSAEVLKKAVDRFMGEEVVVEPDGANMVFHAGIKVKIPVLSGAVNVRKTAKKFEPIGTVSSQDLFDAAKYLSPITDPKSSRPNLASLDFTVDTDDGITIMATDRFAFSTRRIQYSSDKEKKDRRFLITGDDVRKLNSLKDSGTVDLSESNSSVLFSFYNGATATVNKVVDVTINYDALLQSNRDDEQSFIVPVKQLISLVDTAAVLAEISNDVYLHIRPDSLDVYNKGDIVHSSLDITSATFTGDYRFAFSYEVIKETLSAINEDSVQVFFIGSGRTQAIIWKQLKADGTIDDSVYIMCLPLSLSDNRKDGEPVD